MIVAPRPYRPATTLLILLAVAAAARAATFGNPLVHVDEQFYFTAADAWLRGALPFVDIWDRKPLGLFALYLLPAAAGVPAGIWLYQGLALACVVATAWVVAATARAVGWATGALLAAIAYILWLNLAGGQGGQSPVFYNLLIACSAWLVRGDHGAQLKRALGAMALVGLAMQVKYTAVFEGMFFGLWIMTQHWRLHRRPVRTAILAALLVVPALLPTAAVSLYYAASGHWDAYWYANFVSILARRADPIDESLENLLLVSAILGPLIALSVTAWRDDRGAGHADRAFLFGWLATAAGALILFGTWFDHYALPVTLPATICAAGALTNRPRLRRQATWALLAIALIGQVRVVGLRLSRGNAADFAAVRQAVARAPAGCLYVYAAPTMIYPASRRCRVTRYVFPSHLSRLREQGAIGVDQAAELRRIFAARPAAVVLGRRFDGERPEIRALVLRALGQNYRRIALLRVGETPVAVFAATRSR